MHIISAKQTQPSYKAGYAKSASESANPNLWNGLVAAWMPSLGSTGGTLRDVSGNENHGTLTDMDPATDWVTTEKGLALDFDGSDDYVSLGNSSDWNPGAGDFTWNGWIYPNDWKISWNPFFVAGQTTGGFWLGQITGSRDFVVRAYADTNLLTATNIANDEWSYVQIVRRNTQAKLYFNNTLVDSDTVTYSFASGNAYLGSDGGSNPAEKFQGNITNVSIYNRALGDTELRQLYADSLAPFRQRRSIPFGITAAPSFNNWYARPGQTNRIVGSGVHV